VKAIRYASDRLGDSGLVCYVSNHSFIPERSFDGMRKELADDFDLIYVLDLGGNVRKNPKLSGTAHNVFGIQVGVSISLFIKLPKSKGAPSKPAKILYHAVPIDWRKEEKYAFLEKAVSVAGVKWQTLKPGKKGNWLTSKTDEEFSAFMPIGSKDAKKGKAYDTIFRTYSLGVSTNRDAVVYDFDADRLAQRVEQFADDYNAELHRWKKKGRPKDLDDFLKTDKVKWSRDLKLKVEREQELDFDKKNIREGSYRPFTKMALYYAHLAVDVPGAFDKFLPTAKSREENYLLCVNQTVERPFTALATNFCPNLVFTAGFGSASYCLPLFTYSSDGKNRRDNVTTKADVHFSNFYDDASIQRRDIFHYVYALLHHPAYRTRYAENLKRELPRIPFIDREGRLHGPLPPGVKDKRKAKERKADAKVFRHFAKAGERLMALHVGYEQQPEFPLKRIENKKVPLDWRVEKMKLSKDHASLHYNEWLTLAGIPAGVFDYRLGNRSALEWVIDQYRVTRDADDNIVRDPNRLDDEEYIVRLIGQVVHVSVETLKIIGKLPVLKFP
jgi:predicted helicase